MAPVSSYYHRLDTFGIFLNAFNWIYALVLVKVPILTAVVCKYILFANQDVYNNVEIEFINKRTFLTTKSYFLNVINYKTIFI